jgi:hypothetical protein
MMFRLPRSSDPQAAAEMISRHIPAAQEAAVRDILAQAGGELDVALGSIAGALGCLVAERTPGPLHVPLISGAALVAVRACLLRTGATRGRA